VLGLIDAELSELELPMATKARYGILKTGLKRLFEESYVSKE